MSENNTVRGTSGAVDLGSLVPGTAADPAAPPQAPAPAGVVPTPGGVGAGVPAAGPVVDGPLIVEVTEANFQTQTELSDVVPVVLVFYSSRSLTSNQAVSVVEQVARNHQGRFEVGRVDIDAQPQLAQAVQIQNVPTAIALVARRPVPLFEGVPTVEQVSGLVDELLQVAPQLGVTGRLKVSDADLETPMPAAHEAPRAAEEAEDWDTAVTLWKRVLANSPADKEAKIALARAEFEARQAAAAVDAGIDANASLLGQADALFARGDESAAFDLLLDQVREAPSAEEKEAARQRLVELFPIAADAAAVRSARTRLATMLMV